MKGCPSCGRMIEQNNETCPYCNYNFENLNKVFKKYEEAKKITIPKYAGFIKRTVATGIDLFIFDILFTFLNAVYLFAISPSLIPPHAEVEIIKLIWPLLTMPIFYFIYCVFMQYSKKMGTLGEQLLNIEVVDLEDTPVTLSQAFLRNLARILNVLTLGIGYIIIIFTKKKQALSDIVTKTTVTNRLTQENYDGIPYANPFARLIAYVLDIVIIDLIVYGMYFASLFLISLRLPGILSFIPLIFPAFGAVVVFLYFPHLESTKGTTYGKMMLGLEVTDYNGNKISFLRALCRYILFFIQATVPLALLLCLVTPRKQNPNEIITKTIVVKR